VSPRIPAALALSVALLLTATGCHPAARSPTPTPAFTSDAQAFAAAEKTYRAYVEALNKVDLSEPRTFEGVYRWTTGEARAGAEKTFTQMHADRWKVSGITSVQLVEGLLAKPNYTSAQLAVCLDVSRIDLLGPDGRSVVAPDRRDIQSMRVEVARLATSGDWRIASITGRTGAPKCR
jgi:hypothetical protein